MIIQSAAVEPAVVFRDDPAHAGAYLQLAPNGGIAWDADPRQATQFESMREAARAALRLPSTFRAFGLPLRSEVGAFLAH